MQKYELTEITKIVDGTLVHRIRALHSFRNGVNCGDLGGWVESDANLSQDGVCWVYDNAIVTGQAVVHGSAKVMNDAICFGNGTISGWSRVSGACCVGGNYRIDDMSAIVGKCDILGNPVVITGISMLANTLTIRGDVRIANSHLFGNAKIADQRFDSRWERMDE